MPAYDRFAPITREAFADFLDRLACLSTSDLEWNHFVVCHYGDSFLEEIRRCVVRLEVNQLPIHGNTDAGREMLQAWAFLLRSSTNSDRQQKPDIATIDLTPAEAVLLDAVLRRYSESDKLTIQNAAERQCFCNIECLLEKHVDRPAWPSIDAATGELSSEEF